MNCNGAGERSRRVHWFSCSPVTVCPYGNTGRRLYWDSAGARHFTCHLWIMSAMPCRLQKKYTLFCLQKMCIYFLFFSFKGGELGLWKCRVTQGSLQSLKGGKNTEMFLIGIILINLWVSFLCSHSKNKYTGSSGLLQVKKNTMSSTLIHKYNAKDTVWRDGGLFCCVGLFLM